MFSLVLCIVLTLLATVQWTRLHSRPDRALVERTPFDSWTWMAQAVAEAQDRNIVHSKDLTRCYIAHNGAGGIRIVKQGSETPSASELEMSPLVNGSRSAGERQSLTQRRSTQNGDERPNL
jgi:hypothetical protein